MFEYFTLLEAQLAKRPLKDSKKTLPAEKIMIAAGIGAIVLGSLATAVYYGWYW